MTTTPTGAAEAQQQRIARLRGIRFLAAHALATGDAYAFHVGPTGTVSVQGDTGALRGLNQLLNAQPAQASDEQFREWIATVPFEGGLVHVELTESQ